MGQDDNTIRIEIVSTLQGQRTLLSGTQLPYNPYDISRVGVFSPGTILLMPLCKADAYASAFFFPVRLFPPLFPHLPGSSCCRSPEVLATVSATVPPLFVQSF